MKVQNAINTGLDDTLRKHGLKIDQIERQLVGSEDHPTEVEAATEDEEDIQERVSMGTSTGKVEFESKEKKSAKVVGDREKNSKKNSEKKIKLKDNSWKLYTHIFLDCCLQMCESLFLFQRTRLISNCTKEFSQSATWKLPPPP